MKTRWVRLFGVVLVLCAIGLPSAQAAKSKPKTRARADSSPPPAETESGWPAAELTLGFQTRDSETEGIGDLLLPIWNPGGTGLLFLNPRTAVVDHDEEEANLGVGYRQWLPKLDLILGANLFYDYRDADSFDYDQWGFGLELLSPWIDARANYYDPDDERHVVASETQTEIRQTVQSSAGWGSPYAEDHAILQDFVTTRTLTTVTTTRTFEQYEQALGGYDWEIGLRLPIRAEAFEARLFGGYYDFARDFGADARGWKTRAEVRVLGSLYLDAGLYENADLTGSDWFAGARWSVPLDLGQLARGRNPFATAQARLRGEPRDVSARLTEMVLRDPQIRRERSKLLENPDLATVQTMRRVEKDRDPEVLLPDVQFVDGAIAAGAGNGTAETPFPTIQQAANAVFGTRNVYVFDAATPYEENVVLQAGTTLWGSGVRISGFDGQSFGSGIAPVVDGMDRGPSVTLANRTAIQGFRIQNTYQGLPPVLYEGPVANAVAIRDVSRVGLLGDDAAELIIRNNVIAGNETGVYIERGGDFDLLFADNLVANNSDPHDYGADGLARSANGLEIHGTGNSGTFDVSIVDSVIGGNAAFGAQIAAATYDRSVVSVQDSEFLQNAFSGLALSQNGIGDAQARFTSVQADDNGTGLFVGAAAAGTTLVSLQDVSASGNVGFGIGINQLDSDTAIAELADSAATDNDADGFLIQQIAVETAQIELTGSSATGNAGNGLYVLQNASTLAQTDVSRMAASANGDSGIGIFQTENGLATIRVADSAANDNADMGLIALQDDADLAVAAIGGLQADNNGNGLLVQQVDVGVALANVSEACANDNAGRGILLQQVSDVASVGIVGMPDGLAASVAGIADLLGLALPDEIAPFFGPSGAVTASGNGSDGLLYFNVTEGLVALSGLFDATLDDNAANGAILQTVAANGFAVNLLGSSGNWAELAQLGAQVGELFDLDLPLALAGDGRFQANGNGSMGVISLTLGELAALNAAVGIEASGNAAAGLASISQSGDLAVNALARLETSDNGMLGVYQSTFASDLAAVSLLADVNASGNGTDPLTNGGIYSQTASSGGIAVLLGLSTDALRPLAAALGAEYLGEAFELPGEPFGPVVASGNVGFGIQAVVQGNQLAAAALLDVQANDNAGDGIDLALTAANGLTLSLLASSDLLYDVLPGALGADPIANAGLGPFSASGNGGSGIVIDQNGAGPALSLLAGVEANNNAGDDGIQATLASDSSTVGAFLVDVDASYNAAGRGIDLNLAGFDNVLAGLVYVDANDNGQQGIRVLGESADADAYALFAGVDASRNGTLGNQAGLVANLSGAGDAAAALTDVYALQNGGRGANVVLDAGLDANLFVGDFAAEDLDAVYGFSLDLGPLYDLIPTGNSVFSDNGTGGLHAELTSAAGDALVGISGANADNNANMGFNFALNALNGNAIAGIEWAYANDNGGNGFNLNVAGGGGVADVRLNRLGATGNGGSGIQIVENYNGAVGVMGERLVATDNGGNGVRLAMSGLGGVPVLDFGGGGDSAGQSSFFGNGNRDFRYNNGGGATVMAVNNWWGADLDPVANGQTFGSIDADPWMSDPPP